jgi:hypothetical protein
MKYRLVIRGLVVLGLAAAGMVLFHVSPADLGELAKRKAEQAVTDSRTLLNGEYTDRIARRLRDEASKPAAVVAVPGDDYHAEMQRDLEAERRRLLEERAKELERQAARF